MFDLIFGRSFWAMILRFALLPVMLNALALPVYLIFERASDETATKLSLLQYVAILPWSILAWTWFGWGLAFWRFDRSDIPVRSFAAYPMLTGLTTIPVLWVLMSLYAGSSISEYVQVAVFGAFAGPLQALMVASGCRYLPQIIAPRQSRA